jgi:hypothetical protein
MPPAPVRIVRDLRLDLFRGLALLLIFLDHIPSNVISWVTVRNSPAVRTAGSANAGNTSSSICCHFVTPSRDCVVPRRFPLNLSAPIP